MIGGMVVFILGALFGSGAFILLYRMFVDQIEKLRRRNDKLMERANAERVELERARAYRRGYFEGSQAKEAERTEVNEKNGDRAEAEKKNDRRNHPHGG